MSWEFTDDMKTTHMLSSSDSLSKNVEMGGVLNVGSKQGEPNPEPTEIDKSWNSKIAFDIVSDLHDPSQPEGIQTHD